MTETNFTFQVAPLLNRGKANAISGSALANMLGVSSRKMRHIITSEREHGALIAAGTAGYFIPADDSELREYVAIMKSRAISTFTVIRSAQQALKVYDEVHSTDFCRQLTLDDYTQEVDE